MKAINNAYLLAIDQGTTGSRAFVFNAKGEVVNAAYKEFTQYYPKPGLVEHDPDEIWSSVQQVIKRAVKGLDLSRIKALGITNQRETTILWDKKTGVPLYRAIVWQDRRTSAMCADARLTKHHAYIEKTSGLRLDPYFCATKIQWILKNVPAAAKKAKEGQVCFGTIDSWLIYKLTGGKVHATDMTNASRTMLFNIRTKQWDKKLLKIFQVPPSILPNVFSSGHTFGTTAGMAGLPSGIPITAVMGDQQSALFGQGCFSAGSIKNTYGTGCFMLLNTGSSAKFSKNGLLTTIACDQRGHPVYALEGAVFIAGAAKQWLRDGLKVIKHAKDTPTSFKKTKDNAGVYFVPAFTGLGAPYWRPDARGAIVGLTRGANADHIIRAAVEAIAYQTKDVFDIMRQESGLRISALDVDGGASVDDCLMQFQADMLGISIRRPRQLDSTVLGAAQLAGVTAGIWEPGDLKALRKQDKIFSPRMPKRQAEDLYRGWKDAIRRVL